MPKMKTHSASKKRFKTTATGLIKRTKCNKNHILNKKARKRKRNLRHGGFVSPTVQKTVASMLGDH
ncbi:MAG: 50S ribosomal protein L35 [Christensenellaceae bacterium]|jgi:large subunit ribosomal protein L35|nr:50S ribosomal protein L35 [Christensenellaceae bacterium]